MIMFYIFFEIASEIRNNSIWMLSSWNMPQIIDVCSAQGSIGPRMDHRASRGNAPRPLRRAAETPTLRMLHIYSRRTFSVSFYMNIKIRRKRCAAISPGAVVKQAQFTKWAMKRFGQHSKASPNFEQIDRTFLIKLRPVLKVMFDSDTWASLCMHICTT